jgi:ubiquitin-protein ligase
MNRIKILRKQLEKWNKDPEDEISFNETKFYEDYPNPIIIEDNIILHFTFTGPKQTLWQNKVYEGNFVFEKTFPNTPPIVRINSHIHHPNIYNTCSDFGIICISILHAGIDELGEEDEMSRWTPCHNLGSIIRSIITLFHEPFCDSPANVDAGLYYRTDIEKLKLLIAST